MAGSRQSDLLSDVPLHEKGASEAAAAAAPWWPTGEMRSSGGGDTTADSLIDAIKNGVRGLATRPNGDKAPRLWTIGNERIKELRPWGEFLDFRRMSRPRTIGELTSRLAWNIRYFSSNYLFVLAGLMAYCIIMSPLLLASITLIGVGVFFIRRHNGPVSVNGKLYSMRDQWVSLGLLAVPLFFLSSATSVIFWIVGCASCTVGAHAALTPPVRTNNVNDVVQLEAIALAEEDTV